MQIEGEIVVKGDFVADKQFYESLIAIIPIKVKDTNCHLAKKKIEDLG